MNVSGHLLSTAQIESALVEHDAVTEAAVVSFEAQIFIVQLMNSPQGSTSHKGRDVQHTSLNSPPSSQTKTWHFSYPVSSFVQANLPGIYTQCLACRHLTMSHLKQRAHSLGLFRNRNTRNRRYLWQFFWELFHFRNEWNIILFILPPIAEWTEWKESGLLGINRIRVLGEIFGGKSYAAPDIVVLRSPPPWVFRFQI